MTAPRCMPCLRLNKTKLIGLSRKLLSRKIEKVSTEAQHDDGAGPSASRHRYALCLLCGLKFSFTERKDFLLELLSIRLQPWSLDYTSLGWFFVPESLVLLPRGPWRCGTLGSGVGSLRGGPSCVPLPRVLTITCPPSHAAQSRPWMTNMQQKYLDFASQIRF